MYHELSVPSEWKCILGYEGLLNVFALGKSRLGLYCVEIRVTQKEDG